MYQQACVMVLVTVLAVAGCQKDAQNSRTAVPARPETAQQALREVSGMTANEVRAKYGNPDEVMLSGREDGGSCWIYGDVCILFDNLNRVVNVR